MWSDRVILASLAEQESLPGFMYEDRQAVKSLKDSSIGVWLILDSTMSTIKSLDSAYTYYSRAVNPGPQRPSWIILT